MSNTTVVIPIESPKGLNSKVNRHFGHTKHFAVVEVTADGRVNLERIADNPHTAGHQPGEIPAFVKSLGADVILAGAMGRKAIEIFEELEIKVSQAQTDQVLGSIRAFIAGLLDEVEACEDHAFQSEDCTSHQADGSV